MMIDTNRVDSEEILKPGQPVRRYEDERFIKGEGRFSDNRTADKKPASIFCGASMGTRES